MISKTVRENQTIFDLCLWGYGSINEINTFLKDNNLKADSGLVAGSIVYFSKDKGNNRVKDFYSKKKIIPSSSFAPLEYVNFEFINGSNFEFINENNFTFIKKI